MCYNKNMNKIILPFLILPLIFLAGCSVNNSSSSAEGVLKSMDKGGTWEAKVNAGEGKSIASLDILSMIIDPRNSQTIYIGTKKNGIFKTENGAEDWEKTDFPPIKVYAIILNPSDTNILYASGVWQGRGKIYKSENKGAEWKEIYTEPADGTVITSLNINKNQSQILYAGTSEGMIFKTMDGGNSWKNIFKASGAVTEIEFDSSTSETVYFEIFNKGILRTKDGGENIEDLTKNYKSAGVNSGVFSLAVDSNNSGTLYAGLNGGMVKSADFGNTWEEVNILESSKKFPIRALAVNPKNSSQIVYSAAQAIYNSIDSGKQWSTFQLETSGIVEVIKFDPINPDILYAGLRKVK